jgi:hypothetical protein
MNSNFEQAGKIIESKREFMPKDEIATLNRLVGCLLLQGPLNIFFSLTMSPPETNRPPYTYGMLKWVNIDCIFRLCLFISLIVLGTASVIQVLKAHKINYQYIFEIQAAHEVTYMQCYIAAAWMAVVLNACFSLQIMMFKFYWEFPD